MTPQELQQLLASGQSLSSDAPMDDQYQWREALQAQRLQQAGVADPRAQQAAQVLPQSASAPQLQTLAAAPSNAPQLPTPDFSALTNAQGQNPSVQTISPLPASPFAPDPQAKVASPVAPPSAVSSPASAPRAALANVTPAVAAAPQLPAGNAPAMPALFGFAQQAPMRSLYSPAPATAARTNVDTGFAAPQPTFRMASARVPLPSFLDAGLVPTRPYSAAPVMPGYGQARSGNPFRAAFPAGPAAPTIGPVQGPGGPVASGAGGIIGGDGGGGGGLGQSGGLDTGSLFTMPAPSFTPFQDPGLAPGSFYSQFLL